MKQELQDKLYATYPLTLGTRDSCLAQRGIECGDGWYEPLNEMFAKIESILITLNQRQLANILKLSQIKEKFGTMTIYAYTENEEIQDIIREATKKANCLCEVCGKPGHLRGGSWMTTNCDECLAKHFIRGIIQSIDIEKDVKDDKLFEWSEKTHKMVVKDEEWYINAANSLLRKFEGKVFRPRAWEDQS